MAGRRPSFHGNTTSSTTGSFNIIDLTDDSPPCSSHLAAPSQVSDPQGTPNLRPTPTMNLQSVQGGSSVRNMNMQMQMEMQQQLSGMSTQEQIAYANQWRQSQAQMQAARAGNGQIRPVSGPNHTQGNNMGMSAGPRPTTIAQQSMNMPVMRNSPQKYGLQYSGGAVSIPQYQIMPNSMAQSGQMPNATGRHSMPATPGQQQQHGQHQMQWQSGAVYGSARYTPEQLAQYQQHLSANEVDFSNILRNTNHTAGPVPLSNSTHPQTGQKRPLNNASGPPSKRRASQSSGMNGPQRANLSAQNQQLRQNLHTPDAINRAHSISAAMAHQHNPLTQNAMTGGNNISAMMNQMGVVSNLSPEQCQQFLAESQYIQHQQMSQTQRMMQNQQGIQNRQPTQQEVQIQRQQSQNPHSGYVKQLPQNQQHVQYQQYEQNPSINEQRTQIPHQSNAQAGVNSEQHANSVQHQQRVPNAHQYTAQNGDSIQPQTPSAQVLQQAQEQGHRDAFRTLAFQLIRQHRNQRKQSMDMETNPATNEEMNEVRPYLEKYKAHWRAKVGHNAATQVVAPNHTQFPQQNFAPLQQQRPQQQITQEQLKARQRIAPQYHQDQQTLTQRHPVQQPQTCQQLKGEQQKYQVAAVSGTPRASVSSTSASLAVKNKHRQGLPSSPIVTNSYPSPDREDQLSSSPPQQRPAQHSPPNDDIEARLEEGIKTFLRESASPEKSLGHNSSASRVVASSLAPQPSQQSTSSTPKSAMPGTPQSGPGVDGTVMSGPEKLKQSQGANAEASSRASAQQQASLASGSVSNAAPLQQAAVPSPLTSHIDSVTEHVSGEQSRPAPESLSSVVPSRSSHGEISSRGADISATIKGGSGDSPVTINPRLDFLDSITNPGGDWQLLDRADAGYGLLDPNPSYTLLPDDAWVDAADMGDKRRQENLRNFLHPEAMTVDKGSNIVQEYGSDWNDSHWDYVSDVMVQDGNQRSGRQVEEEVEPGVEAEPVFASHKGSFTSATDAFNHRINQDLGVGWEVYRDPSLFPDRDAGSVDPTTLQMIKDGTYLPTSFEFGNVNDGVARPSVNGEVVSSKE
ncbi:hypothetical protein BLS_008810 [Venturia inaequalis]|uniref:Uncharacterized protein n=1 Tax=Venturia inaequalis TaxID=5025 RepID=A0A8H3YZU8_VENIN|nr:hypothetical protein BLS_008810 [Venturia inaequalis]RDI80328.1 hypothetical protein Vi05172_g9762 [Venturia inaequalis]